MTLALANAQREAERVVLWQMTWEALSTAAGMETLTTALALKIIEGLSTLCDTNVQEFKYSANVQVYFYLCCKFRYNTQYMCLYLIFVGKTMFKSSESAPTVRIMIYLNLNFGETDIDG